MLRNPHYTLMLGAIGALLVAIVLVVKSGIDTPFSQGAAVFVATVENTSEAQSAVVVESSEPSRGDRLDSLRNKISKMSNTVIAAATSDEIEPEASEEEIESDDPETPTEQATEHRCESYRAGGIGWNSQGLLLEEVEGGRLVYREVAGEPLASSSEPVPTRDVVLQLPVRSVSPGNHNCIATDVIGIAKDGSLIRNNEVGTYQVFGADTVVGYALDGFPIYGASSSQTDECGGKMLAGQYRYQISGERDTIISCYSGIPVTI